MTKAALPQTPRKTLRLLMPQWQGSGNNPIYPLGATLLSWLAPDSGDPLIEVPIAPFEPGAPLEDGVYWRTALMAQLRSARQIIDEHAPDRIVVFGGDCLVEQAPFAYLNERYDGRLGVLWIDAHPDIATPEHRQSAHTMVLGNLIGGGDEQFAKAVERPLDPNLVALVGLTDTFDYEDELLQRAGLSRFDMAGTDVCGRILQWIEARGIERLAIHFDLDALHPDIFRSTGFAKPQMNENTQPNPRAGNMTFNQVREIVRGVSAATDVVALGITEHMPWDALNLKELLDSFPILAPKD